MATSSSNIQTCYHARSNSLPSRPHPIASEVGEHLSRLASSEPASISSNLNRKLGSLQDLHDCIDKLLQLPSTQQILAQEQQRQHADELLNGSLGLLDVCTTARDALLQVNVCTLELQSILRRKRGATTGLANEVRKYLTSRKAARKAILKALKNSKYNENKQSTVIKDATVSLLREVQEVTLNVLESLLSFTFGPDKESKMSRWSLVLKLLQTKREGTEAEQQINEMVNAEASLLSLASSKFAGITQIENVQNELKKSESCIRDFEEGLEGLFRRLIKIRVDVLNILNH